MCDTGIIRATGEAGREIGSVDPRTELKPCPLCTGNARDRGHGISCEDCGLWLGDGSQAYSLGGYKAVWNRRAQDASSPTGKSSDLRP